MATLAKTSADSGVLRATFVGEFSLAEAEQNFLEILDAAAHHETDKILLDGRDVQGNVQTIERFLFGEFTAHAVARYTQERSPRRVPQFAYVIHEPILDPQRFGETVAVNRGMWVKVFDNLEEALRWLNVGPVEEVSRRLETTR
jgi:hypothetical protein